MIVRILGDAQYEVDEGHRTELESLDTQLLAAVDGGDEVAFRTALAAVVAAVRSGGSPVDDDAPTPSEMVVPFDDATLEETRRLLADGVGEL